MTTPLQQAAQALIEQHLPTYLDQHVAELRKALDAEIAQSVEPYAVFHGLVDSGEHGAFNLDLLKMIPRGAYLYLHPPQPQAVTTGWDNGLSQDYCKELGQWLASRPGARQQIKEMFEGEKP